VTEDTVGAFVPGPRATLPPLADGALGGLDLAVKDLFDVAGHPTTYGHPRWAETHPPAGATAPAVTALLAAGARLVGKTKTVELAFGLTGENPWHGTPLNPAAPDRFPGGSSCGSAAAVAGGVAHLALGSDTGGSVRIPASYCGLFGLRPTFGAVTLAGACGLAPGFDTAGWFARDAATLEHAGDALLPGGGAGTLGPLLAATEVWANADPAVAAALRRPLQRLERLLGPAIAVQAVPEGLDQLFAAFRTLQSAEAWATQGAWIEAARPEFSPAVRDRFAAAKATPPAQVPRAMAVRRAVQARLRGLLAGGAVLAFPTSPCAAPPISATPEQLQAVRERTVCVTAIAGMAGLCEVTLPAARVEGAPVGLSLAAAPGQDRALLALAVRAAALLELGAK
jgi:amidase